MERASSEDIFCLSHYALILKEKSYGRITSQLLTICSFFEMFPFFSKTALPNMSKKELNKTGCEIFPGRSGYAPILVWKSHNLHFLTVLWKLFDCSQKVSYQFQG